jgi:hypothetical protein
MIDDVGEGILRCHVQATDHGVQRLPNHLGQQVTDLLVRALTCGRAHHTRFPPASSQRRTAHLGFFPPGWLSLRTGWRGAMEVGITASGRHPVVLAPVCGFLLAGRSPLGLAERYAHCWPCGPSALSLAVRESIAGRLRHLSATQPGRDIGRLRQHLAQRGGCDEYASDALNLVTRMVIVTGKDLLDLELTDVAAYARPTTPVGDRWTHCRWPIWGCTPWARLRGHRRRWRSRAARASCRRAG